MYKLSWEMVDAVRSISASEQRSVRDSQSGLPRASLASNQRSDINIPGKRSFCTGDGQKSTRLRMLDGEIHEPR